MKSEDNLQEDSSFNGFHNNLFFCIFACPGCKTSNDGAQQVRRSYLYNFLGRIKCESILYDASDFFVAVAAYIQYFI